MSDLVTAVCSRASNEGYPKVREDFTTTKKAPTIMTLLTSIKHSVLNVKALVGAFNQEKALVGAFSVIVQPVVEPMEHYTALDSGVSTTCPF